MKVWSNALLLGLLLAAQAQANIVSSDLQNFAPASSAQDGLSVSSARTLGAGKLSLGLFLDHAINTLPYFQDSEETERWDRNRNINDTVTLVDAQFAYGITRNLDLSLSLPAIVAQNYRDDEGTFGYYDKKGYLGYRLGGKWRLWEGSFYQLALAANLFYNRIDDNPYAASVPLGSTAFEVLQSFDLGLFMWNINLGYRWRQGQGSEFIQSLLPIERFGDQWIYSTSVEVPLGQKLSLEAEVYGARNWDELSAYSPRGTSISEGLVGLKSKWFEQLDWHLAVGGELDHSISSADLRFVTGLRWQWGSKPKATQKPEPPILSYQPPVAKADLVIDIDEVYFRFDSVEFRDKKQPKTLEHLADVLSRHEGIRKVIIEGHTCDLGKDAYNLSLSDRRAAAVERWLIRYYGIAASKLESIGWGEHQPKLRNDSAEHRRVNRRVSFKIYFDKDKSSPADRNQGTLSSR